MSSLATLNANETRQMDTHSPLSLDERKALPIKKLSWLSPEEYSETMDKVSSISQVTKDNYKRLAKDFIDVYPNPKEWLETPLGYQ